MSFPLITLRVPYVPLDPGSWEVQILQHSLRATSLLLLPTASTTDLCSLESSNLRYLQKKMASCISCDSATVLHIPVMSVFTFIAIVSVIMRVVARKSQRTSIELNDYLCIFALVEQI